MTETQFTKATLIVKEIERLKMAKMEILNHIKGFKATKEEIEQFSKIVEKAFNDKIVGLNVEFNLL